MFLSSSENFFLGTKWLRFPFSLIVDFCKDKSSGQYADPADCSSFYNYAHGHVTHKQHYQPKLLFNSYRKLCDWPRNVQCLDQTTTTFAPTITEAKTTTTTKAQTTTSATTTTEEPTTTSASTTKKAQTTTSYMSFSQLRQKSRQHFSFNYHRRADNTSASTTTEAPTTEPDTTSLEVVHTMSHRWPEPVL